MSLSFRSAGTKNTTAFVADPDPNVTPPAAARIVELADRSENNAIAKDVRGYLSLVGVASVPAFDFAPWVLDEGTGAWTQLPTKTGILDKGFFTVERVAPARMFFQFTALAGGTATGAEIFVASV